VRYWTIWPLKVAGRPSRQSKAGDKSTEQLWMGKEWLKHTKRAYDASIHSLDHHYFMSGDRRHRKPQAPEFMLLENAKQGQLSP